MSENSSGQETALDPAVVSEPQAPAAPSATPTPDQDRLEFWDLLRGVAVLGILLANMPYMSLASALSETEGTLGGDMSRLDRLAFWFVRFFADTKFITIFSILFGAGLAHISERTAARGTSFIKLYVRRLLALLLFGILHGTLVWFGDILTTYALLGFLLIPFRKCRPKTLIKWSAALFLVGAAVAAVMGIFDPAELVERRTATDGTLLSVEESERLTRDEYAQIFASGDFVRMLGTRVELYVATTMIVALFFGARTLAMFVLGIWLVRTQILSRVSEHERFFRRALVTGALVGLPLQVVSVILALRIDTPAERITSQLALYFGGFAFASAYVAAVALWSISRSWTSLRARLVAVGKMAFTNYIGHSVITAILFNYCGLFDHIDRATGLLVALAIFALQLWLSPLWLRCFTMGPLEWLWRMLTYGRKIAIKRVPTNRVLAPH